MPRTGVAGKLGSAPRPDRWTYTDADGVPLFEVRRTEPKRFSQWRLENGAWIAGVGGVTKVLYRLPELLEAVQAGRRIYVTEGEKDADNVCRRGLDATTAAGGAGAPWLSAYSAALRGAHVVILPDNDDPGEAHARKVATGLRGSAASVRVLRLP